MKILQKFKKNKVHSFESEQQGNETWNRPETIIEACQQLEDAYTKAANYLRSMAGGKMDAPETRSVFTNMNAYICFLENEIKAYMRFRQENRKCLLAEAMPEHSIVVMEGKEYVVEKSEGKSYLIPQ